MYRLEFERAAGYEVSDEEWRTIELIYMNTDAIVSVEQMARIYVNLEKEDLDAIFSLITERGRMIETVGELRSELSSVKKEVRHLKRFRDEIIKEAERVEIGIPSRYWEPQPDTREERRQAEEVARERREKSGMPDAPDELPFT